MILANEPSSMTASPAWDEALVEAHHRSSMDQWAEKDREGRDG
jgi:hypothetical protein